MTTAATFWDNIADKYATRPIPDEAAYATTLERTRQYLCKTDEVLELGCGTGTTALKLAPFVSKITATDVSERMVEIGRKKAKEAEIKNVMFARSSVENASVETHRYDAILAFNLLHLLHNPAAEVRLLSKQIKPGGVFISKTPCLGSSGLWMKPVLKLMQLAGKAPYVGFLSARQLEKDIEEAGLEIIEVGNYPSRRNRFVVARKL